MDENAGWRHPKKKHISRRKRKRIKNEPKYNNDALNDKM